MQSRSSCMTTFEDIITSYLLIDRAWLCMPAGEEAWLGGSSKRYCVGLWARLWPSYEQQSMSVILSCRRTTCA